MATTNLDLIKTNPARAGFREATENRQADRRFEQESQLRQDELYQNERARQMDEALADLLAGPTSSLSPAQRDAGAVPAAVGTPPAPSAAPAPRSLQDVGVPTQTGVGRGLAERGFGTAGLNLITAGEEITRGQQRSALERQDRLHKEELERQDRLEREAFVALAQFGRTGNPGYLQNFQTIAQRAGLRIPPEIIQNTRRAGLFAEASVIAERIYKDSPPAQTSNFIRAYMQSEGNLEEAVAAAGAPIAKPDYSVQTVMQEGKTVLALLDKSTANVMIPTQTITETEQVPSRIPYMYEEKTTTREEPYQVEPSRSAGQRTPARLQEVQWLLDTKVATDAEEAWAMVNKAKSNPDAIRARVFSTIFSELMSAISPPPLEEAMAQANAAADGFITRATGQAAPEGEQQRLRYNPATGEFE